MHGGRCRLETRLSRNLSLSLSLSLYVWSYVCVCGVHSTACGRPRLASGLYRDYICKTIRLNHFLNKRAWPLLPPAVQRSGSDRRAILTRLRERRGTGEKGVRFNPWVKYSVARSTYARGTPSLLCADWPFLQRARGFATFGNKWACTRDRLARELYGAS